MRVLVVEDDRDTAESLRALLVLCGYEVTLAHTSQSAALAAPGPRLMGIASGPTAQVSFSVGQGLAHVLIEGLIDQAPKHGVRSRLAIQIARDPLESRIECETIFRPSRGCGKKKQCGEDQSNHGISVSAGRTAVKAAMREH